MAVRLPKLCRNPISAHTYPCQHSEGDDVVHFEDAERELVATPVAPAFLLAEPDVHGLPVGHRNVDLGAAGDLGAGCSSRLRNRLPMDCCRRMLTSSTALGDMSSPTHCRAKF